MKRSLQLTALLLLSITAPGQNAAPSWTDWHFLLGEWTADSSNGVPGQASSGSFTLFPDLRGQVLVRKNHAEYPASGGRPAVVHDDLMIIYWETGATKAFYHDSEGHVIRYNISFSVDKRKIVFLSEKSESSPQYRLTYQDLQPGTARVLFEIAPPDKPNQFTTYVQATVRRKT